MASATASAAAVPAHSDSRACDAMKPVDIRTHTDEQAVELFREYLRMRTDHPSPTAGYEAACEMLKREATELGLSYTRLELSAGHPCALIHWEGAAPHLPSIVLNSHMDVVPVEADKWSMDPWAAEVRDGKIYGRGTQDMKSVGMQYLEAVRRLRARGFRPTRSLYLLYVADEEVGGNRGIKLLLGHSIMKSINAGLVLDEGLASPSDKYTVFYGERKIWWIRVTAEGPVGHGSRFVQGTAVEKLLRVADKMLAFREEQRKALEENCACGKQLGDYTTLNLTMLKAGEPNRFQYNVIPSVAEAGFDCRIPCTVDLEAFRKQVGDWCSEDGVKYELVNGTDLGATEHSVSSVAPDSFWWSVFQKACERADIPLQEPSVFPAATDSRWIRMMLGTPCFGFSPMRRTPILLHDHDEFVAIDVFLEGIGVYERMIPGLTEAAEPGCGPAAAK